MLLTITYTGSPASELGYLLHKNPARLQSYDLSFGKAHVFYPEITANCCTAALLLDINPVTLARGRKNNAHESLFSYVNDRPYVASSFMSVAIARIFGTALTGRSKERQQLADRQLPLTAKISVLPSNGGEALIRRLFEPLGYQLEVKGYPLDEKFDWGESLLFTVTLFAECRLADLLQHLYVLIPVLDVNKHYWVGEDEIDKLLQHGKGWLASHPEKELITSRYLKRQRNLVNEALERLLVDEMPAVSPKTDEPEPAESESESGFERKTNLNEQRLAQVIATLKELEAKRVLDVGCGGGKLLSMLLRDRWFAELAGMDVSQRILDKAHERLKLDRLSSTRQEQVTLFQGALTYTDKRLQGYDAVTAIEVIEHLDPNRLRTFEKVMFEFARPPSVVLTTPNQEYNTRFAKLSEELRHQDHRFEWTRAEFIDWGQSVAERNGYQFRVAGIGEEDPSLGPPTQMGVFTR